MLVEKIKNWIDNKEEWFFDFLTEMTKDGKYGDDMSGDYPDDVEFDDNEVDIRNETWNRCGSDYYYASIPVEHIVKKLRKDKLEEIKNN